MKYLFFFKRNYIRLRFWLQKCKHPCNGIWKGTPEVQGENTDSHQPGYKIRSYTPTSKEIQLQYLDLQFLETPSFQEQEKKQVAADLKYFNQAFLLPRQNHSDKTVKSMLGILSTHEETAVVKLN